MRYKRLFILLLLLLASLASCSPGHVGGNEIAFVRDGHLWTMDPDGANAFEVVNDSVPVVGYAWSPTHRIFFYRTLDQAFARTPAGKHLIINPITGLFGDLPSTLNTIGIDGGSPIPIMFSNPSIDFSNAWWNTSGTRLLYREEFSLLTRTPATVQWWVSQNDQPGGIARKALPNSFSIPSIAPYSFLAIGNNERGIFTTTLAGTNLHYIEQGQLPGHPLPATLERILWQPAHHNPAILYAIATASGHSGSSGKANLTLALVLRATNGRTTMLTSCACTQFAWSPDGNHILYSSGSTFTVLDINTGSSFSFNAETSSVPYWSPGSRFLLLDGLHTLQLVNIATRQQQVVLSDGSEPSGSATPAAIPGVQALLQPVSNSLWAPDSRHFLFLTRGRLLWQGKKLGSQGLYTVTIDDRGQPQGQPTLADAGNDTEAGWSFEDANTSFLY